MRSGVLYGAAQVSLRHSSACKAEVLRECCCCTDRQTAGWIDMKDPPEDEGGDEGPAGFRQVSTEDSCRADDTAAHRAQPFGSGAIPKQGSNNSSHSTCNTRQL